MTDDLADLAADLKKLVQVDAPPMRLDIPRALKAGAQRRRRRRISMAGGIAVLAVAVGLVVPRVMVTPGSSDTTSAASTSTGSNPLIAHASFGWLPDVVVGVGYTAGEHGDAVLARGSGGDFPPYIYLHLYPAGDRPELGDFPDGRERVEIPAPPVNGRTAYWVSADSADPTNNGDTYLRWQTASGKWAEVHAYYLSVPDLQGTLLRVAADVTVGDRPVPLPLHISELPADFRISEVDFWRPPLDGPRGWLLQLFYTANGGQVTIDVFPENTAWEEKEKGSTCKTAMALHVCILSGPSPSSLNAIGGPEALLKRITLLGTDEEKWTTRVIG